MPNIGRSVVQIICSSQGTDIQQLKMMHLREQSYIIFQCRQQSTDLYGRKGKPRDEVKELVTALLLHGRYMCKAEDREVTIDICWQGVIDAKRGNSGV